MKTKQDLISAIARGVIEFHAGTCVVEIGPRGGEKTLTATWRISGQLKQWKTQPNEFRLPIKFGLYDNYQIDHNNLHMFHASDECHPKRTQVKRVS